MVMPQVNQQEQQGYPHVIPCYDELIAFLKQWFPKTREKAVFENGRFNDSTGTYTKIAEWTVSEQSSFGQLKEIAVVCDNYSPLSLRLIIAGVEQKDIVLLSPLSIPYKDLKVMPREKVAVYAKSDGSATIKCDATITAREIFLIT